MYFLYSLLLGLAFFALLPYFAYQAFCRRKYLSNFSERLGRLPAGLGGDGRPAIWPHAASGGGPPGGGGGEGRPPIWLPPVSVGEALAGRPLLSALRARLPAYRLIVSTTTA